jgi:hypothetical protein
LHKEARHQGQKVQSAGIPVIDDDDDAQHGFMVCSPPKSQNKFPYDSPFFPLSRSERDGKFLKKVACLASLISG